LNVEEFSKNKYEKRRGEEKRGGERKNKGEKEREFFEPFVCCGVLMCILGGSLLYSTRSSTATKTLIKGLKSHPKLN